MAGQSDVEEKMLKSLLKKTPVRVDSVTRQVPPSEIRRNARRGCSQLEYGLRGALSWSVLLPSQKLITIIKILHQSGRAVWYTGVLELLFEENLVGS